MRALRLTILTIAAAVVLVPTLARAHQRIERRDATRLSIKHSWLGVAPPTKASVAPVAIAVLPVPAEIPAEPGRIAGAVPPVVQPVCRAVRPGPEPLRGPPQSAF